jgi:hypothetical protein
VEVNVVVFKKTSAGLAEFTELDTVAVALLSGETRPSLFLHHVKIINDPAIRSSIDFNCIFIIVDFKLLMNKCLKTVNKKIFY